MPLFSKERVLVPIDFSDLSFQAQQSALEFVEDASHLHILHVLPQLNPGEPGVMWKAVDNQARIQNVEQTFQEKFSGSEYSGVNFQVTVGDPSSEIIDYAKHHNITLVVIPSHGRTGLGRFFMGSVAERVVRFSHCPVLVLRQ